MPIIHYIDSVGKPSVFPIGPGDQHSLARSSFTRLLRVFRGVEVTSGDMTLSIIIGLVEILPSTLWGIADKTPTDRPAIIIRQRRHFWVQLLAPFEREIVGEIGPEHPPV